MHKSSLCNYSDTYILVSRTIAVVGVGADAAARATNRDDKQAIFKNCTSFTDCITETNNTQVDNAKDLDAVMLMYNLIEYTDIYLKTSGTLYQFYRDKPNENDITESESFKIRTKFVDNTNNASIINAKIVVPLKYLINFLKTLEKPLIICEINLIPTWSANCLISEGNRATTFAITHTKLYVPVVTLST